MRAYMVLLLLCISSCAPGPQTPHSDVGQAPESQPVQEYFEFVGGHLTVFPVVIAGTRRRFILDTGIGINLISETLCAELQCTITDSFQSKRMSGQVVDVKLAQIGAVSLAGHRQEQSTVGVIDMDSFMPKFANVDGFLSLNFFENTAFTLDYNSQTLTIETDSSMKDIANVGYELTIGVTRDGPSLSVFMPMSVASKKLRLEVDTGSASLILHERYAEALEVDLSGDKVRRVEGQDETNNSYTRYFAQVAGPVHAFSFPQVAQENLQVMFQDIIYDGLVGKSFLSQFRVTFDLAARRMIFRRLSQGPGGTDCHMHIREAGSTGPQGAAEALAALHEAGLERGCVISTGYHRPKGCKDWHCEAQRGATRQANVWALEQANSSQSLLGFCGIPVGPGWVSEEIDNCVKEGAQGIKLHLVSQKFSLSEPSTGEALSKIADVAAEHQLPILIHLDHQNAEEVQRFFRIAQSNPETIFIVVSLPPNRGQSLSLSLSS